MAEDRLNGRYELIRPFGAGGMADIWTGRDLRLGRIVVVKLIRLAGDASDEERRRRFDREARLAAQLDHPGVPTIYDFGCGDDGRPFLVMQRIDGIDLAALAEEQAPLPIAWVAAIGAQVSSVLMAAHRTGLIHRDIKPSNLMLDRYGAVKVLDFGVAGVLGRDDISRITRTGEGVGTPGYMAPEQILGEPTIAQTDIYGLGCTLYELLAGRQPFTGRSTYTVLNGHLDTSPDPLPQLRSAIPAELDDLIMAMIEKRPEDRPGDAATVYDRLVDFVEDLPDLPGMLAPANDPVRAYHALNRRVPTVTEAGPPGAGTGAVIDRFELSRARAEAEALMEASKLDDAKRVLSRVVGPAMQVFGAHDSELLEVREMYADVLYDAGELRAAAREYRTIADDRIARYGDADERAWACRLYAARAHAMLGEQARARNQMNSLLRDCMRLNGPDDETVAELRQEIDALGTGTG